MSESFRTLGPGVSLEASKASDYIPMLKTDLMFPQATNARSMTAPDTHVRNAILCIDVSNIIEYFFVNRFFLTLQALQKESI